MSAHTLADRLLRSIRSRNGRLSWAAASVTVQRRISPKRRSVPMWFFGLIRDRLANAEQQHKDSLESLLGKAAIASAKLAYQDYLSIRESSSWRKLQQAGANPQRLLWASTSTKNPAYRDVLYVEELIGPETVTTVPFETLASFRDHGIARSSLTESPDEATAVLESLAAHDISLEAVTQQLTRDGVELFSQANDRLLSTLASNDSHHEASQ